MAICSRLKDFRAFFYFLALASTLFTIMFTFLDVKAAKVLFYWSCYFAMAGIVGRWRDYDRKRLWFLAVLFVLGLSKVIWFYWAYRGVVHYNGYNDYMNSGKRLLLACIVGYWLFSQMQHYREKSLLLIKSGLIVAFFVATAYGFWQYSRGMDRVAFALDRATISAYGYAMLSSMVLFLLASEKHSTGNILASLVIFCLSYFVLVQTGTRNMMAAYPLIILLVGVLQFRHFGLKMLLSMLVALAVLVTLSYKPMIKPRLEATLNEVDTYTQSDGNQLGSLTTRLAMWRVGAYCLAENPLGMTTEARTVCFQRYVDIYHQDKVSLMYANVHLHDELLDSASLQGVQGALVMLLFYIMLVVHALRSRNALLLAMMVGIIVSGLTDVVFISRELTVCMALMLLVSEMWNGLKRHNDVTMAI